MSERIQFLVYGESAEPDQVVFTKNNNDIDVTCTCQLKEFALPCYHYIYILDGDMKRFASDNWNDIETVREWLRGSHLGQLYDTYKEACENLESATSRFSKAKIDLARMAKAP